MAPPAEEARAHLECAEKALKPSWLSLKFGPDLLAASLELTQAATKFRAAGLLPECVRAWSRAAELQEQQHDLFAAGRAHESAGTVCDGTGPGGPAAAAAHWQQAARCFRLAGKVDIVVRLLLKLATLREKEGDHAKAKEAYADAVEVLEQEEKDYGLGDIYKQYIGFLVRSNLFDDASGAMDAHANLLARQGHHAFAHKELLSKVILRLHQQDTVGAEEAMNPSAEVHGWYSSRECEVGSGLVQAFQQNDAEAAERLVKEQVLTFLQVEVARLAQQLRVASAPSPGGAAAGAPEPQDLASLLM